MPKIPPEGRRFQKGQSGNPKGSSKKAREMGNISALIAERFKESAGFLLSGNAKNCHDILQDETSNNLERMLANFIETCVATGDVKPFVAIMDRLLGRPKEQVTLRGDANSPIVARTESTEEKLERLERLRKAREAVSDNGQ